MTKTSTDGGNTWVNPHRLLSRPFWESGCPLASIKAVCYYRPHSTGDQYIFFSSAGNQYSIYDDYNKSWSSVSTISQFGGGGCPFTSIGAITFYRQIGNGLQLILFNITGDYYSVYSENCGIQTWQGPYTISQMGGGGCPFSTIGSAYYYRPINGGRQLIFFNSTGDKYVVYSEYCGLPTWQGYYYLYQWGDGKCPFTAIKSVFNYTTNDGDVAFFDKSSNVYRVFDKTAGRWTKPIEACPNFLKVGNQLWMFYLMKYFDNDVYSYVCYSISGDNGQTWSTEKVIDGTNSGNYFVLENNRVTQLSSDNRIIVPVAKRITPDYFKSMCYYLLNGSSTWQSSNMVNIVYNGINVGAEEPGIIELDNSGTIMMYFRHGPQLGADYIYKTISTNYGVSWNFPTAITSIPIYRTSNLIKKISYNNTIYLLAFYADGTLQTNINNPVCTKISTNSGVTWSNRKIFLSGNSGEQFGYESALVINNNVNISYGHGTSSVSERLFVSKDFSWFIGQ